MMLIDRVKLIVCEINFGENSEIYENGYGTICDTVRIK